MLSPGKKREDIESGIKASTSQEIWIVDASVDTLLKFVIEALGIASWRAGVDVRHALELTLADGSVYDALRGVNNGSENISSLDGVSYDACDTSFQI